MKLIKFFKFLVAMIFIFIIILFGTANDEKVSLNFRGDKPLWGYDEVEQEPAVTPEGTTVYQKPLKVPHKVSLWKIMFSCFFLGFLVAFLISFQDSLTIRSRLKRSKKMLTKAEQELESLKQVTIPEPSPPAMIDEPDKKTSL
ncbi:LapA family protein [candidate division CSSED10-310 bacterium]|uniref:LapA family protein n=1 Tax=candidate division CSSED10-310 bacterium TaxID=2855610 RepID=A0ABV6Z5L9_UNCC1